MMLTEKQARDFASRWIEAWNSHDLDAIMSHYANDVVLTSPVAAKLLNEPFGAIVGTAGVRAYFEHGLEVYPQLKFSLIDVFWGMSSIVICFENQNGTRTAEFLELDRRGLVIRAVANYND
jgi:hypothetical protein